MESIQKRIYYELMDTEVIILFLGVLNIVFTSSGTL